MKKILLLVAFLSINQAFSQEWFTNFEMAKKEATNSNKHIVLVFQGSDWCAPCMKLEKEIWSAPEFQKLSRDTFVFLKADFPRRKKNILSEDQQKHNALLAEKYNPNGYFPLVVVLDKDGNILGKLGYEKSTPKDYFNKLASF